MIDSVIGNEVRQSSLIKLLQSKQHLRIIELHSPISALITENTTYGSGSDNIEYDI